MIMTAVGLLCDVGGSGSGSAKLPRALPVPADVNRGKWRWGVDCARNGRIKVLHACRQAAVKGSESNRNNG